MVTGMTAGNPRGTGNRDPSDEMSGGFFVLKSGRDCALIFLQSPEVFSINGGGDDRVIIAA